MSMGFAPTWLRQVSPLLHMTTLITAKAPKKGEMVEHLLRDRI